MGTSADSRMCLITGFDASGVLTDAEVRELFGRLPTLHTAIKTLNSIRYEDQIKEDVHPGARRISTHQVFGEWVQSDDTNEAHAVIYRQHEEQGNPNAFAFKHTTLHEVAHGVFLRLLPGSHRSEWYVHSGGSMILFNEQSRDPVEHFAHLYAAYVLNPIPLLRRFEPFYGFLRESVFDGTEFHNG